MEHCPHCHSEGVYYVQERTAELTDECFEYIGGHWKCYACGWLQYDKIQHNTPTLTPRFLAQVLKDKRIKINLKSYNFGDKNESSPLQENKKVSKV